MISRWYYSKSRVWNLWILFQHHQVLVDKIHVRCTQDPFSCLLSLACFILDRGVPDNYPRRHQLIQPARGHEATIDDNPVPESLFPSRLNTALTNQSESRRKPNEPSKLTTPTSQLSYKAMTPRAERPLDGFTLQRDGGHGRSQTQAHSSQGNKPNQSTEGRTNSKRTKARK